MTLQPINVDDRNYAQLLDILKKQLPSEAWDDHNPSDPGIMLLEMLTWLGEMKLYRMNRIDDLHREKHLKLIIDPPEPVTVTVELAVTINSSRTESFIIPPGIRFATRFKNGKRYIFESFERTEVDPPPPPQPTDPLAVTIRNWKEITGEELGVSSGRPNQAFKLKEGPVLLDYVHETDPSATYPYLPNPKVTVNGAAWELKPFLFTEESKVAPGSLANHFMVDDFDNTIRFGDGDYGAIPGEGAVIVYERYQTIEGAEALIKAGEIRFMLDEIPNLQSGESVTIAQQDGLFKSQDAEGGWYVSSPDADFSARLSTGLTNFRERYRLVTAGDFERVLLDDFNRLQKRTKENPFNEMDGSPPDTLREIKRVEAVMNVEPRLSQFVRKPGHVTIMVIPEFDSKIMQDETVSVSVKQDLINLRVPLEEKIQRFLDMRRLITTRTHVISARLRPIDMRLTLVVDKNKNVKEMDALVRNKLSAFFDILIGHFSNKGWSIGGPVRKSQLYRLIEGLEGVDHVESLRLDVPADTAVVPLADDQLPLMASVSINIIRN